MNVASLALSASAVAGLALAMTSDMVTPLGLLSFAFATSIAGIVLGHRGLRAAKRGEAERRGLGISGLIAGHVTLAVVLAMTVFSLAFLALIVFAPAR